MNTPDLSFLDELKPLEEVIAEIKEWNSKYLFDPEYEDEEMMEAITKPDWEDFNECGERGS